MEYELTTIKDILEKVPVSKIEQCMEELTVLLKQAKTIKNITEMAGNGAALDFVCPDTFTWVDDGRGSIELGLSMHGEEVMKINTVLHSARS